MRAVWHGIWSIVAVVVILVFWLMAASLVLNTLGWGQR